MMDENLYGRVLELFPDISSQYLRLLISSLELPDRALEADPFEEAVNHVLDLHGDYPKEGLEEAAPAAVASAAAAADAGSTPSDGASPAPSCHRGARCRRRSLDSFAQFSHDKDGGVGATSDGAAPYATPPPKKQTPSSAAPALSKANASTTLSSRTPGAPSVGRVFIDLDDESDDVPTAPFATSPILSSSSAAASARTAVPTPAVAVVEDEDDNEPALKRLRPSDRPRPAEVSAAFAEDVAPPAAPHARPTPAFEDALSQLLEVFPDLPLRRLRRALEACDGQVDAAIDALLVLGLPNATSPEDDGSADDDDDGSADDVSTPVRPPSSSADAHRVSVPASAASGPSTRPTDAAALEPASADEALVPALQEAEELRLHRQRIENDNKAQQAIIQLLLEEKQRAEESAAARRPPPIMPDRLYLPGEREALAGTRVARFELLPSAAADSDPASVHFRIAESQFLRLGQGGQFHVTKVVYLVNPPLVKKFEEMRLRLAEKMEWEETKPILCFHGTSQHNMESIIANNFDLAKVGSSTDAGYYGRGVYLSEASTISIGYARGFNALLLCQVLLGRCFKATKKVGRPLEAGFDSHVSPCGNEIVIFDNAQILPTYIVHYAPGAAKPIAAAKASAVARKASGVAKKARGAAAEAGAGGCATQ